MENRKKDTPMEQRELVTYINHFITSTVMFLNNFMSHCEMKMMKSEHRLQKISASLCILETKLNSVPELQNSESQLISTSEPLSKSALLPNHQEEKESPKIETVEESSKIENTEARVSKSDESPITDDSPKELAVDPTLLKYRKMLQFGVPRGAVELKMVHEGLDPKLL